MNECNTCYNTKTKAFVYNSYGSNKEKLWMCIQNLDIRIKPLYTDGFLPILLKFKLVPSGYIMNNSRTPKGKVQKHTKHHKILFFTIKPCVPTQLATATLYTKYPWKLFIVLFCVYLHEKAFPSQTAALALHCITVLLRTSQTPLSSEQLGNSSRHMKSICHVSLSSRRK